MSWPAGIAILCSVVVLTGGCGEEADDDFPAAATREISADSHAREFATPGELAATSTHVVRGRVADVERGAEVRYQDGSGAVVTPRILVVPVDHYLFSRHAGSPRPSEMRVIDGYWEEGEGYAQSDAGWLQPGDPVVLFVSRDRAPDGSPMDTYTPLGTEGRVVLDVERPEYDSAAGSVWAYLGERASAADLEVAIDQAVSRARSGEARPVLVTVCFPSDPQDEDSEPICKEM